MGGLKNVYAIGAGEGFLLLSLSISSRSMILAFIYGLDLPNDLWEFHEI